jgi:hypothetical protein
MRMIAVWLCLPVLLAAAPTEAAIAGFDAYAREAESGILNRIPASADSKPRGRHVNLPGALLHDWRASATVPGATASDFERLLRDVPSYPKYFAPQVLDARVISQDVDRIQMRMRVQQRHLITVVMDASYDVEFRHLDPRHGYSISRSTRIEDGHDLMWRLNTYWSYAEIDGGLHLQIETISLTRSIPKGLGWMIGPYVESIPRESMEFTLRAVCAGLRV